MNELWAKDTGETILQHTVNVVEVGNKVCHGLPFSVMERQNLYSVITKLGVSHDLGKAAEGFQNSLREKTFWGHRHEVISAAVANNIFPTLPREGLLAIITHHRSVPESLTSEGEKCLPNDELPFEDVNPIWELMTKEWLKNWEAVKRLLLSLASRYDLRMANLSTKFELNSLGLPERLLNRNYQEKDTGFNRRYASLLRGLLITSDHIASAHEFDLPEIPIQKDYIPVISRQELKGNDLLPFQKRCGETIGNAILKAPTGSGKTAAILLWAANNQAENGRLFYVLPHTASINAMHKRLQKIYCEKAVGVLHHKNTAYLFRLFENDYSSTDAAKMAQTVAGLARELYHPIRVTTPHQILRVALKGKGWELGLSEFPNACFVFDEIHAFEPLLVGLTIATIKWLKSMGAKVLFASATLPLFLERALQCEVDIPDGNIIVPEPHLEGDKEVLGKIRHDIEIRVGNLLSNLDVITNEIEASQKTALIICNHVATSQTVCKKIKERISDAKLLHARFNSEDRFKIEFEIQGKRPPRVLVATQAVEVSLDLDYDCGYIEPAPADALGQRLGRINRRGSRNKPVPVVIFEEPSASSKDNPLYLPYDELIVKKTVELFRNCQLLTEQQLTSIVSQIYGDGYQGDSKTEFDRGLGNQTIRQFDDNIIAGTHKDWVEDVIEGSDGQVEVLPMELIERFHELQKEKQYLKAKLLFVPIQIRQCRKLFNDRVLFQDKKLDEYVTRLAYSPEYGLDLLREVENIF
ncbi:MAG: CRISPR-associated helicase Cas3' [Nitrospirae bacterium]|nr:CRISPR-associated helicase Cas3' [Nitrospirota bacterium]